MTQDTQDVFLNVCRRDNRAVTVYLVNGVKLQGTISGFDDLSLVLKRAGQSQLVYKHSIATVVPASSVESVDGLDGSAETDHVPGIPLDRPFLS